jgi:hypothetical protein
MPPAYSRGAEGNYQIMIKTDIVGGLVLITILRIRMPAIFCMQRCHILLGHGIREMLLYYSDFIGPHLATHIVLKPRL